MHSTNYAIGAFSILVLIFVASIFLRTEDEVWNASTHTFSESTEHWASRIGRIGPTRAYAEFAESVAALDQSDAHQGAHAFGSALFDVEGEQGLTTCDNRFSFGCFHQFLGRAIAVEGLAVVGRLNEACFHALPTTSLSCQHGIGHGILAAFGYTDKDLLRALEECEHLPYGDPIGGCYGGVFMEYNFETLKRTDGRHPNEGVSLGEPCRSLRAPFEKACWYWQPQWWAQQVYHHASTTKEYAALGALCARYAEPRGYAKDCYQGIGNIVTNSAGFEAERVVQLCDALDTSTQHHLWCREVAANHLGVDGDTDASYRACAGLPKRSEAECIAWAENRQNVFTQSTQL